jgi:molecular chaperone DnaK
MSYALGVDLGTTYTSAAVLNDGQLKQVPLGVRSIDIASVLFLTDDGEWLIGEEAERQGVLRPERLSREVKRRVGDSTAILVGGSPYSAQRLMAILLQRVVELVTAKQGGLPSRVVVTHPANWGSYKLDLLRQEFGTLGLPDVHLVAEPYAAAVHFDAVHSVSGGEVIAVYDLGGGTFDAAVLRRSDYGFALLGSPDGVEHLGGFDFDEVVFHHVLQAVGGVSDTWDADGEVDLTSLAQLRRDCVAAKEMLSRDTDATIPVLLPGTREQVRLTRPEFEALIRPTLEPTLDSLARAVASAELTTDDLTCILLVGGSSRIPLVGVVVADRFARPIELGSEPEHAVALGAALLGGQDQSSVPPMAVDDEHAQARARAGAGNRQHAPPVAPPGHQETTAVRPEGSREAGRQLPAGEGRTSTSPQAPAAPPRRATPSPAVVAACTLPIIALLVAALGPAAGGKPPAREWQPVTLQGQQVGHDGVVQVDLGKDIDIGRLPDAAVDGSDVTLQVTVVGVGVGKSSVGKVTGHGTTLSLRNAKLLAAGPVKAKLQLDYQHKRAETELLLVPKRPWWATIPGGVLVGLLLFVAAYGEAILRPVRRRRRLRVADSVALTLLGAATGAALVLAAWAIGDRLLRPVGVVLVIGALAFAGGCVGRAVAPRGRSPAPSGRSTTP